MRRWLGLLLAGLACTGCAVAPRTPAAQAQQSDLTVFAAASLSKLLPQLDPHPAYLFDGSAGLVDQLSAGATADVLLTADERTMRRAEEAGLVRDPVMFASNHLVLVTPKGNPARIEDLASLAGKKLVICAPEVPCGDAAQRLAQLHQIALQPSSEESKVSDVLGKVAAGEADAGLVYTTDATASQQVDVVEISRAAEVPNTYWAAVLVEAPHPAPAARFVAKLDNEWAEHLQAAGFAVPT